MPVKEVPEANLADFGHSFEGCIRNNINESEVVST